MFCNLIYWSEGHGININQIVGRKSYQCDIPFRIIRFFEKNNQKYALLYGEDIRLIADSPVSDLVPLDSRATERLLAPFRSLEEQSYHLFRQDVQFIKERQEYNITEGLEKQIKYFHLPGKVLHVDGDPNYLNKCLMLYKRFHVPVIGIYCDEKEMPYKVPLWVSEYRPDILVITGHDAYTKAKGLKSDISAYRHSKDFVQTVKEVRKIVPHLDQLIIFAGACQSHFESLIRAGANFASSPMRVNIHALDPVYIVAKLSYSPFSESVKVWDILRNTITGEKGIGGIESRGVLRVGMPFHPNIEEET